jgi:hypothetical protein
VRLYEANYHCWVRETSERLRRGEFSQIDLAALVDEVEDFGKRERSALESRLAVLVCHLLKWDCQPAKRSRSWQAAVELQRVRVEKLLKQSPSLRPFAAEALPEICAEAVLRAIRETGFERRAFATGCPYTIEEILKTKDVRLSE